MKTAEATLAYLTIRLELIDEYIAKSNVESESDRSTRRALADLVEFMTGTRP
jgi:hypothetical protein